MDNWKIDDSAFSAQYNTASRAGKKAAAAELRALSARYLRASGRLAIELTNGATVLIPVRLLQGMHEATPKQLSNVSVVAGGYGLSWPDLDCDFTVPGLVLGLFGTKTWMSILARAAGRVTTPVKAKAARENGKKGGRPLAKERAA